MTLQEAVVLFSLLYAFSRAKAFMYIYVMSKFLDGTLTRKRAAISIAILYPLFWAILLGPLLWRGGSIGASAVVLSIFMIGGIVIGGMTWLILRTYEDPVIRVPRPSLNVEAVPANQMIAFWAFLGVPLALYVCGVSTWPLAIIGVSSALIARMLLLRIMKRAGGIA